MREKLVITARWVLFEKKQNNVGTGVFEPRHISWEGNLYDFRSGMEDKTSLKISDAGTVKNITELFEALELKFGSELLKSSDNECLITITGGENELRVDGPMRDRKYYIHRSLAPEELTQLATLLNASTRP